MQGFDSSPFGFPVASRVIHSLVLLFFCRMHVVLKFGGAVIATIIDVVIIISKTLFLVCWVFLNEMRHMQFLSICQSVYLVICQA